VRRVVADASFCGAWVLEDEASEEADLLLQKIESGEVGLIVPSLWKYEMFNVLRSACRRGRLDTTEALAAQTALERVPLAQVDFPDQAAGAQILTLAEKFNLSAYDASYLELADRFKVPLQTTDRSLKQAAHSLGISTQSV